ncbi:MAG TPA: acyl-CoA dehydrogenase family protein [Actinomycetota bacterium]|nr:acyl-CoA dehydrogenase family protein [Actinomycetota bacterium]
MDFAFSEEQQMLRDGARGFLASKVPSDTVAELAESDAGWDRALWPQIAELGWLGLSVAEDAGGAGMGFIEDAVLFEEMGYALFPGPFFSTVALALPVLAGRSDAASDVIEGRATATFAWAEAGGPTDLKDIRDLATKAEGSDGEWTLTGEKDLVTDLGAADLIVVAAQGSGGVGLWLVRADGDGITKTELLGLDGTRRMGRLSLNGAPAELLVEPGEAAEVIGSVRLRALTALAVEATGISQRVLDLAKAYVSERQQFGKPIGTYQAVSHQVANMYMDTELARSTGYWAAWAVAENDESAIGAASAAKAAAGPSAVLACERAIQVHGGIGFTYEHILHRYYKRAQWIEAFEGSSAMHRAELAKTLLD